MAEGLKPGLRLRRRRICPLGGWLIHKGAPQTGSNKKMGISVKKRIRKVRRC